MVLRRRGARVYEVLVAIGGFAAATLMFTKPWIVGVQRAPIQFTLLTVLVLLGELNPVTMMRRGEPEEVSPSMAFAFAILLSRGIGAAMAVQVFASVSANVAKERALRATIGDAARRAIPLAAAGFVLDAFRDPAPMADLHIGAVDVMPLALASIAFFLLTSLFLAIDTSIEQQTATSRQLGQELQFQASTTGVLLGMAPVAVLVAQDNPLLLPFLLLPAAAVYTSVRNAIEKERQALHDALTGLPNRACFRRDVQRAIEDGVAGGDRLAVMLMDLDRFKEVNDTLGHHVGDQLLIQVGPRLTTGIAGMVAVARLGGDEFVIVAKVRNADDAVKVARDLVETVEAPFVVDGLKLDLEASIGIALYPEDGDEVDSLLQRADVAMYLAKEAHSGVEVYTSDRDRNSRQKLQLLGELREAISHRDLVLFYQPQADLRTGRVASVEALVRWHHPQLGLIPPAEFVPIAEHSGLIEPLTRVVLEEAVAQCSLWSLAGKPLRVAVNLSARVLHDLSLPQQIADLLEKWKVPAELLALEITESTIMADPIRALRVMTTLSGMGVRLAIDDFGTGYSSLAYLRRLPVSEIKIDKSFVSGMATNENDAIIVRSTVELGRNLGLEVAAEGVESEEVWSMLVDLGCHLAQGYYLSRAVTAETLEPWLVDQALALDVEGMDGIEVPAAVAPLPGPLPRTSADAEPISSFLPVMPVMPAPSGQEHRRFAPRTPVREDARPATWTGIRAAD